MLRAFSAMGVCPLHPRRRQRRAFHRMMAAFARTVCLQNPRQHRDAFHPTRDAAATGACPEPRRPAFVPCGRVPVPQPAVPRPASATGAYLGHSLRHQDAFRRMRAAVLRDARCLGCRRLDDFRGKARDLFCCPFCCLSCCLSMADGAADQPQRPVLPPTPRARAERISDCGLPCR